MYTSVQILSRLTAVFSCARLTQDLVEYYKQHSLKEGFSSLDTTLQVPYQELSNGNMPKAITKIGNGESASQTSRFLPWHFLLDRWKHCRLGSYLEPVICERCSKQSFCFDLFPRPVSVTFAIKTDQIKNKDVFFSLFFSWKAANLPTVHKRHSLCWIFFILSNRMGGRNYFAKQLVQILTFFLNQTIWFLRGWDLQ